MKDFVGRSISIFMDGLIGVHHIVLCKECEVCAASFALPFMASAVWMSSVTAPATRLEHIASCCFSSAVGLCRTYSIHTDTYYTKLERTEKRQRQNSPECVLR